MKNVTKETIKKLPVLRFPGTIRLVRQQQELQMCLNELEKHTILGFDTEKRPSFRKGECYHPSLIQLATHDTAYLLQISRLGFNREIIQLLENPDIEKVGVAIKDDLSELNALKKFHPAGFSDLARMARDVNIPYYGLRNLTAYFLDKRLSKSQQTSNWANDQLTEAQQHYAATDAWVSLQLYHKMTMIEGVQKD